MTTSIVHISDLHLRENWHEEQGFVLREFFQDLEKQISEIDDVFVIFTGDILQQGKDPETYQYFSDTFGAKLSALGLSRERLIFLPGNHDVDRAYTQSQFSVLKGIQEREISETDFNNNVYGDQNELLKRKFQPFLEWQESVSDWPLTKNLFCGRGFNLTGEIGIYCLNTALYSFGGLKDEESNTISDYQMLPVETRRLHEWVENSTHKYRILAMHHPHDWLVDWAGKEIDKLCFRYFDLVLSGHVHKNSAYHITSGPETLARCVAPPLFSTNSDMLGYSILEIQEETKGLTIHYRQWVEDRFVLGTALSKTDTGTVQLANTQLKETDAMHQENAQKYDAISALLKNNMDRALKCYASLPAIWVVPNLSDSDEFSSSNADVVTISADQLIAPFRDCIIVAPPQFGLSSLGHYLAHAAWEAKPGRYAMVIESREVQNHDTAIEKYVQSRLDEVGLIIDDLTAIILDEPGSINKRKVDNIKKLYPNIPLLILLRVSDHDIIGMVGEQLNNSFQALYLWSLERPQIREIVRQFIDAGRNLDEEAALQRLVDDIKLLNLHRTPLNCLTLLTVYENQIDYSPTNRTDMFERFLFLIFYSYKKNPDYSSFPDMKDALSVLGAFCEDAIRTKNIQFKKNEFILASTKFCEEMSIDVDCSQLFEVMNCENIIIKNGSVYRFRYVHWIYFFGAHRMHHDAEFCDFVLSNAYYMNFPEIIEFYSGVDRRREELLKVLISDLKTVNDAFETRTNISPDFDPYLFGHWKPTDEAVVELRSHLEDAATQSSLPVTLKDNIADKNYERSRPYIQEIQEFVKDSSLIDCMQILTAAARALRNSDYVKSEIKAELLFEILRAWTKEIQVMFLLSPILAKQGQARYHNINFFLSAGFEKYDGDELWSRIVGALPPTAVSMHDKDIASSRMMPLFKKLLDSDEIGAAEYLLAGVIIKNRPDKWSDVIGDCIRRLPKNSFYLLQIYNLLFHEHKYGFVSPKAKNELFNLLGMTVAKHETGAKSPNKKLIDKTKDSLREMLDKTKD